MTSPLRVRVTQSLTTPALEPESAMRAPPPDLEELLNGQRSEGERDLNEVVHQLILETDDKTIKRRRKRLNKDQRQFLEDQF